MRYAQGRKAKGTCDRCGLVYRLSALRQQVVDDVRTTLRVCPDCLDEDNPQGFPAKWLRKTEAIGVRDPRPDPADHGVLLSKGGLALDGLGSYVVGIELECWPYRALGQANV